MNIYSYEEAFGAWDQTSKAMRKAIENWFSLYYGAAGKDTDPAQRIAYTVVTKLTKTVFGEYKATAKDPVAQQVLESLNRLRKQALQLSLIGGECYIKPVLENGKPDFTLVPRNNLLIFDRDRWGMPTDVGTVEKTAGDKCYYTLLERRKVDDKGYLTIENRLFKSFSAEKLGTEVSLSEVGAYAALPQSYTYPGLYELKTPKAPAVYLEVDFHDNEEVAKWLTENPEVIGEAICKGVCKYFAVDYVPPVGGKIYRVQVGAYAVKENAQAMVEFLQKVGVAAFVTEGVKNE